MKCSECGFDNPCVINDTCKECNEQYKYCYNECKFPCRSKEEQEKYFTKWNPDWKND